MPIQLGAARRLLLASKIKTTNSKYAYTELYVGEGFNKVKSSNEESFIDGAAVYVEEKNAKTAVEVWTKLAKRLTSDFKATNDEYASGTWHDPQSKCTWKVEITHGDRGASIRFRNKSQTHEILRYEESDN